MNEDVLLEKINNLGDKIEKGFEETNSNLRTLNGQIVKHANLITSLEKEDIRIIAELKPKKLPYYMITALISIVLLLLGRYVY